MLIFLLASGLAVFATMFTVAALDSRRARLQRRREAIHREPVIDNVIDVDHFTDRYYQPGECTDESTGWIPHQYKRDPIIWDRQDDGFYDNPANREFSLRIKRKIRMNYFDREGQATERHIETLRLGESSLGEAQVLAFCHTHMRNLAFRLASCSECVDLDTGLRVAGLEEYLRAVYTDSAQASVDMVVSEYRDVIAAMIFLAANDSLTQTPVLDEFTRLYRLIANDDRISTAMVADANKSIKQIDRSEFEIAVCRFTQMRLPFDFEEVANAIFGSLEDPDTQSIRAIAYVEKRALHPVPL